MSTATECSAVGSSACDQGWLFSCIGRLRSYVCPFVRQAWGAKMMLTSSEVTIITCQDISKCCMLPEAHPLGFPASGSMH